MHIAILFEYGTVNGGENSMLAMIEHLEGIRFTAIAPTTGRLCARLRDVRVQHVGFSRTPADSAGGRESTLARLAEMIRSISPDVLHGNSLSMGRLTGHLSQSLSIPTSAHLRDILRLSRAAVTDLNRNDRLFAVSRATRDFHVGQGLDPLRTSVLYNGINQHDFHPRQRTGWLHEELNLPSAAKLVASIGQISLRKGQDVLLQTAIQTAGELPEVHWLIGGERYSEKQESIDFEAELHERIADVGLEGRVHWLGYREDIPRMLPELDLLVNPARQEPLGRILLEAAACEVPIIATSVGGTAEIFDPDSAVLIPPNDPAAISEAVRSLIGDGRRRAEIGAAAGRVVGNRFRIVDRAQALAAHWRKLIDMG